MVKKVNWKEGDECYFEFEMHKVKRVEDGKVTCIAGDWWGSDFRYSMQPINDRTTRISNEFYKCYKRLNRYCGLNLPSIKGYLIDFWMAACDCEELETTNIRVCKDFVDEIERLCGPDVKVNGVQIFNVRMDE